jgi:hypothetical protein
MMVRYRPQDAAKEKKRTPRECLISIYSDYAVIVHGEAKPLRAREQELSYIHEAIAAYMQFGMSF